MQRHIAVVVGLVLSAAVAAASNTGFKLSYDLRVAPFGQSGSNWVSLPYFFYPDGDVSNNAPSAEDWCTDMNGGDASAGSPVSGVAYFDPATDLFTNKFCVGPTRGFTLVPGVAYAVRLDNGAPDPSTIAIVGSHDDDYAGNKGGTAVIDLLVAPAGLSSTNWLSVPYHVMANDAEELCTMVNGDPRAGAPVQSIARFDVLTDTFFTKFCVGPTLGFAIEPGRGYAFRPDQAGGQVQFDVY